MIGPDELHDLLHAHAATIEPIPHLAELGAGLTAVERHRRTRAVVSTTIAAVAVAAAVTTMRAIETRSSRIDTAPATQRIVVAPVPQTALPATVPAVAGDASAPSTPTTAAPAAVPNPPPSTAPAGTAVVAPTAPAAGTAPANTGTHTGGTRILTFRAASVSDLSPANPPAVDYFGVAPPGATVTATSTYGTASTQAGPDGKWSIHLVLPNAPLGQRVRVVLSAPPLPALTFNFTHTAG